MDRFFTEAKIENMESVLDFVNGKIKGFPPKIQNQIAIAVDEVFSNIARYAYQETGGVKISVDVSNDITVEFEDNGAAFDPLAADGPDITLPAEERAPGGLGIFLVKKLMDSAEYRREGDKNILTIKKKCL